MDEKQKINKSESEWKELLTPLEFSVLRNKATEPPFTGKYNNFYEVGEYVCAGCNEPLFLSDTKFNAGCGWPSFFKPINKNAIKEIEDLSYGMKRTEIVCAKCNGHLGHVFNDGPKPTYLRYCINSASLKFVEKKK